MKPGHFVGIILPLCFFLLAGCATTDIVALPGPGTTGFSASAFPEVQLTSVQGKVTAGKLLKFANGVVTFLPFPYWGVEELSVPVQDIAFIKILEAKGHAGGAFLSGFGVSYLVIGAMYAARSKYNVDYQSDLWLTPVSSAMIGGIAAAVAALADASQKKNFSFLEMSVPEKIDRLRRIMGVRG